MDRRELRLNQALGIFMGLFGGWMTATLWPELQQTLGTGGAMLWGAALGGIAASLAQFEAVGRLVTRSPNRFVNLTVGLCLPLLLILVLWGALRLMGR